jgi:uncharacterized membrane protein
VDARRLIAGSCRHAREHRSFAAISLPHAPARAQGHLEVLQHRAAHWRYIRDRRSGTQQRVLPQADEETRMQRLSEWKPRYHVLGTGIVGALAASLAACGGGGDAPASTDSAARMSVAAAPAVQRAQDAARADAAVPRRYAIDILAPVTPGHVVSSASAVNDEGLVVGNSTTLLQDNRVGLLWSGAVGAELRSPPDPCTTAFAINDAGQVAGSRSCSGETHAVRWDGVTPVDLSLPGEFSSQALGINQAGDVVGTSGGRAILWRGTTATELTSLGGPINIARALNDVGQAVGQSNTWLDPMHLRQGLPHATVWNGTTPTDLGVPFIGAVRLNFSEALDINNAGQIVGYVTDGIFAKAVLWQGTTAVDLSPPGSASSRANGINNQGVIVGSSGAVFQEHATFWTGSVATDLNTLVPPSVASGGWVLASASAINDHGVIVGNLINSSDPFGGRGFKLTPLTDKEQCKGGGWERFGFSNQGQCVRFVVTGS